MKKHRLYILLVLLGFGSCEEVLEPPPVDLLTNDVALNEPRDVELVRNGLYAAARGTASPTVIAGDFTADLLAFNGTFTQYLEFSSKQITASNAAVSALWGSIYNTVYLANLIVERLPNIAGVSARQRAEVLAEARFLRGYAYFIAAYSFGRVPLVTTTDLETNRGIPRASQEAILAQVREDYQFALDQIPAAPANAGFAGVNAVRAALARYHLYAGDWPLAEQYATEVINSGKYTLAPQYADLITKDFTSEAIFEMGYTLSDDPGTGSVGLNN
ncbi:MAG: RagB/SusD family nutrient uptake outer membrane protein, partial [Ferruginibacter sp.]|nr:RagB/SusD family nutrient uptake outer membrane protein [Cytophagales bacterium]